MNPDVIKRLEEAYAYHQNGNSEIARNAYQEILDSDPENIHALNLLGMLNLETGSPEDAAKLISRAIEIEPTDPQAQNNYGLALKDIQKVDEASKAFREAVNLDPLNPTYLNNLGSVLSDQFKPDEAVECYIQALKIHPDYPECLSNLSHGFNQINRSQDAIDAARRAISLAQDNAEAHNYLADALMKHCAYEEAIKHYSIASDLVEDYWDALINKSVAQKDSGQIKAARATLEDVIDRAPSHPRTYYVHGLLMEQLGKLDTAERDYLKAIDLNPEYGAVYYQLSQLKDYSISANDEAKIQGWLNSKTVSSEQKKHAAFTLSRLFAARKKYANSLECLETGHKIILGQTRYDDETVRHWYNDIERVFSKLKFVPITKPSKRPIPLFIVGMPRSGTSLTEQILTSHSAISGGGESSFLEDTINEAKRITGQPFPRCMLLLSETQKQSLGAMYLERLISKPTDDYYVIDKTPYNFQYLGFIPEILPQAKIMRCQRDPMDNCLSIFRLPFDRSQSYAHRQTSLGQFYKRYDGLMTFWHSWMKGHILDVQYEDVVADIEAQARRMLEHLDLPFEDVVLDFHRSKAIVRTPSAGQVRQPIYTDSIAYWQRYGDGLASLKVALEANS